MEDREKVGGEGGREQSKWIRVIQSNDLIFILAAIVFFFSIKIEYELPVATDISRTPRPGFYNVISQEKEPRTPG